MVDGTALSLRDLRRKVRNGVLDLSGHGLTRLPAGIAHLTKLQDLDLSDNQLTYLPPDITHLTKLQNLDLYNNQLTHIPPHITHLTNLQWLDISSNQLTHLPPDISRLANLEWLHLDDNQLTYLPPDITHLTKLQWLDLEDNQLTHLPPNISRLTNLEWLDLDNNQLTHLPPDISCLTNLQWLYLNNNQLTHLPPDIASLLKRGLSISVEGNPLPDPYPEMLARGSGALTAYLLSLTDAVAVYEAKLLLVGEGNVGKSCLVAALRGEEFIEGRPTTHGIEIRPLALSHPELNTDMIVRAWDFGGQEVYRITHQFFFSARAVYVVVWKPREGQERNEVEGWLRRIRLRVADKAHVLIVATHCEDRYGELAVGQLRQAFPHLVVGHYKVDSQANQGIYELRKEIAAYAAKLPHVGQLWPRRWVAVRDEVLALAAAEPQIPYQQYLDICERENVTGDETTTLINLLHDRGHVIYYRDDDGLRDFIVLNPEWLAKAISYVLEDRPTRAAGGMLDHTRLTDIWSQQHDGDRYPVEYHPFVLRLMEKFDVSYRLADDDHRSLVAQLVPDEEPPLPWDIDTPVPDDMRAITVMYRLSEPAPGLIAWLTVRHHNASTGRHWTSGVFLRHPIDAYNSEALLRVSLDGQVTLQVRAPSPDLFFNVLRDSIEDLIRTRWPGLTYDLPISCPGLDANNNPQELNVTADATFSDIHRNQEYPAQAANVIRHIIKALGTEVSDCPRLCTIIHEKVTGFSLRRLFQRRYKITLWCEHTGHPHPCLDAEYHAHLPRLLVDDIAPYLRFVLATLRVAVPVTDGAAGVVLTEAQLKAASDHIELMKALVAKLPTHINDNRRSIDSHESNSPLTPAQGQALRAFRIMLFRQDPIRAFGGLRRVLAPSGEYIWVCPTHYREYDPGLPIIPLS